MTIPLPFPTPELAARILAKCSYADRLVAGRLTSRLGITRGSVRGLPEVHLFLTPDDRTLPAINLERLADWIETVVADADLARETRVAVRGAGSYVEACIATYALVGQRLDQARAALDAGAGNEPARTEAGS